jgi:hypothetical protein
MLSKNFKIILFTAITGLFLSSCESVKSAVGIKQSKVWIEKINFKSTANANDSSPIKIHVVVAYTENLATEIGKLDANAYFQKAKKNTGRSLCCSGASKRFFLPIALVAQVVHEEKANHNQPKDQQKMMNFHGNLLF